MSILTRAQFDKIMQLKFGELPANHPLWSVEQSTRNYSHSTASYFVKVVPLKISSNNIKPQYWKWCNDNLKSTLSCYYSDPDNEEEYWGFSGPAQIVQQDISLWLLKWAS
jgi:hypothetical protein